VKLWSLYFPFLTKTEMLQQILVQIPNFNMRHQSVLLLSCYYVWSNMARRAGAFWQLLVAKAAETEIPHKLALQYEPSV
jgi:hypothetical protein